MLQVLLADQAHHFWDLLTLLNVLLRVSITSLFYLFEAIAPP